MENLNNDQRIAAEKIQKWFLHDTIIKQVFVLSGYAGTGKTYLINFVIKNILNLKDSDVAFVTPTGKAASVLIQRGRDAQTIHRLIYSTIEEEVKLPNSDKTIKKIKFVKKPSIKTYKLIILDEVSMVDKKVLDDLLSFNIPVLASGDSAQLPPIFGSNGLLDHPDGQLTEIVRQSSDNAIIKIATLARNNRHIFSGNYGDVMVIDRRFISEEKLKHLYLNADQILCGRNETRHMINDIVRKFKGYSGKFPKDGEKVICNVNDWSVYLDDESKYNLVNGTIGYAYDFKENSPELNIGTMSFEPDFLPGKVRDELPVDSGLFKNNCPTYDMHQHAFVNSDGSFSLKKEYKKTCGSNLKEIMDTAAEMLETSLHAVDLVQVENFEFAYAVSVHKSQGSEWNNVVVIDESRSFGKNAYKWLYTAITRAKKKLVIIR